MEQAAIYTYVLIAPLPQAWRAEAQAARKGVRWFRSRFADTGAIPRYAHPSGNGTTALLPRPASCGVGCLAFLCKDTVHMDWRRKLSRHVANRFVERISDLLAERNEFVEVPRS